MRSWRDPKPASLQQPARPDLSAGLCVGHPLARYWISDNQAERNAAAAICRSGCPVIGACAEFAISIPIGNGGAVYAGLTTQELQKRRSAWLKAQRARRPPSAETLRKRKRDARRKAAAQIAGRTSLASRNPGALARALAELRKDPARSDRLVAASARVDAATVRRARRLDPAALAPQARMQRPRTLRHRSRVRDLILAGATTREIIAQAGVTRQAVWRMRRSLAA
jgi:hypothetical protein